MSDARTGRRSTRERLRRLRPVVGLRLRLLGWALLLLAFASLASVVIIHQVLINELDNRVRSDLLQEVTEFRQLVGGVNPQTGEPFGTDVVAIADTYLARNVPHQGQAVLIFLDGRLHAVSAEAPFDLSTDPELVGRWTTVTSSLWGQTGTPAGDARWLAVPITVDGEVRGQVVVASFIGGQMAEIDRLVRVTATGCLLVIAVVAAGGYFAMGRALRPLRTVTETARRIEQTDDLSRRIEVTGSDEVAHLGRTFNAMLERLERAFAAQQAFLSDVGHELRTPITIVRGHLELMGDDPQERRETVALVMDELDRMSRMVDDLLVLARAERPDFLRPETVAVARLMTDLFVKATALGPRHWRLGEVAQVTVRGDPHRLTQALTQLVQNAVQFTTEGDTIELSATVTDGWLHLSVRDTGVGIDPADQERIFQRFARVGAGAHRRDGTGLGLAIVAAIAAAHRGRVTVDSAPGAGSTFTLVLPMEQPAGPPRQGVGSADDRGDAAAPPAAQTRSAVADTGAGSNEAPDVSVDAPAGSREDPVVSAEPLTASGGAPAAVSTPRSTAPGVAG